MESSVLWRNCGAAAGVLRIAHQVCNTCRTNVPPRERIETLESSAAGWMLFCGAHFLVPWAVFGVVALLCCCLQFYVSRGTRRWHTRRQLTGACGGGGGVGRRRRPDVCRCCLLREHKPFGQGFVGDAVSQRFDGLSCGEPVLGSCLCPRTPGSTSLGTM